jgi:hypothetical protein
LHIIKVYRFDKPAKIFWYLLIRSCLLVGHVPVCRIVVSRCALVISQWNRRWSID